MSNQEVNILLIGNQGQLGQELAQILRNQGQKLIAVAKNDLDLTQSAAISHMIQTHQPQVIVNCAAYTAVDKAESEIELAHQINGVASGIMAAEAEKLGAYLIHVSTDYVFNGTKGSPYLENDLTEPLSVYGASKLAGEQAIIEACTRYLILRTAWVYGVYGKGNFVKTMLRLGAEREEIRVVSDQIGSPTWTGDLAEAMSQLIPKLSTDITGIYHYTNSGVASWYDFAVAIFEEAQQLDFPLKVKQVVPITTADYPTPAKRPAYSVLSCGKITKVFGKFPPHWRESLKLMLKHYKEQI